MSSDPPNDDRLPRSERPHADLTTASLVRLRGAPLLDALEKHQPGAREHAEATGSYAFAAAVVLELGRAGAELCRETAKLHDIGRIYVRVQTLSTPEAGLAPDQLAEIDRRYEAGARLALGAGIPDDVCGWLLQVRERYDGQGPDGLTAGAIPIASRVTRAACICALTLSQPGSDVAPTPLPERRASAIDHLYAEAGRMLDPDVVEALASVLSAA